MPHQCTTCGHVFDDGSKEMLSGCPDCGGNTFQFHPKGTNVPADPPDADPPDPEGSSTANTVGRAATKVRDFVSSDDGPEPDPTADPAGATPSGQTEPATAASGPDPDATWPSEQEPDDDLPRDEDGIIDADAREAARAASTDADDGGVRPDSSDTAGDAGDTAGRTGADAAPGGTALASGTDGAAGNASAVNGGEPGDGRVASTPDEDQPDISELREQLNDQFESIKILEPGQYELNLMELYDREEYIIALQENGRYVIQVPEQWLGDQPGEP
jgi:predicted  nucleic acid-binding Zn-ribbon protein